MLKCGSIDILKEETSTNVTSYYQLEDGEWGFDDSANDYNERKVDGFEESFECSECYSIEMELED